MNTTPFLRNLNEDKAEHRELVLDETSDYTDSFACQDRVCRPYFQTWWITPTFQEF